MERPKPSMLEYRASRRGFLKGAAVAPVVAPFLLHDIRQNGIDSPPPEIPLSEPTQPIQSSNSQSVEESHEQHHSSLVNDLTAYAETAYFAGLVSLSAMGKITFNAKTALASTAIESARIGALTLAGDAEALKHEKVELMSGYQLLPVLILFAESASHLKVQNDAIFKGNDERILQFPPNASEVKPPHPGEGLEVWNEYLDGQKNVLINTVAQNAAITSVLAPITTTYTSAAVARESFKRIQKQMEKVYFAERVIDEKRTEGSNGNDEQSHPFFTEQINEWEEDAKKKSIDGINGVGGYLQLNIALASNSNGAWGFGDPPNFYFASRHMNPELLIKAHSLGAGMSELASAVLTYSWLTKTVGGINPKNFLEKFLSGQKTTLEAFIGSFADRTERDLSYKGGRATGKQLFEDLERIKNLTDQPADARAEIPIRDLPDFSFYFDPTTVAREKLEVIQNKLMPLLLEPDQKPTPEIDEHEGTGRFTYDDFIRLLNSSGNIEHIILRNKKGVVGLVEHIRSLRLEDTTSDATALIEELILQEKRVDLDTLISKLLNIPLDKNPFNGEKVAESLVILEKDIQEEEAFSDFTNKFDVYSRNYYRHKRKSRGKVLKRLADEVNSDHFSIITTADPELLKDLDEIINDRQNGAKAYDVQQRLTGISNRLHSIRAEGKRRELGSLFEAMGALGIRDMQRSFENAVLLSEREETPHQEKKLLEHASQEVLVTLSTQLPVVASLIHTVEKALPQLAEVDQQAGPTLDQLKKMASMVLGFEAITSAFADNVAAYLFAEGVLNELMSQYYGEEQYAKMTQLKDAVALTSLFTAIFAGSLTKIGNGPTVTMSELDESGEFRDIRFGKTLLNPFAYAQTGMTLASSIGILTNLMEEKDEKLDIH